MPICECNHCGVSFERYRMNATRAAKPQFCSPQCFSATAENRAQSKFRERLLKNIAVSGDEECWLWTGRLDPRGYGRFDVRFPGELRARPRLAHRLVYTVLVGPVPDNMMICHRCDNPPCCNPAHHFVGTPKDNFDDMVKKGRKPPLPIHRGEEIKSSKLLEPQVIEILASSESACDLARKYGVTAGAIHLIKKGRNWAHLSGNSS